MTNINTSREMKLKSILMPKWKFKLYEKFLIVKKNIKLKEINISKKWLDINISNWLIFSISWSEAGYDEGKANLNLSILWLHLYLYTSQKLEKYNKDTYDEHKGDREWGIKIHNNVFWIYNGLKHNAFEFPYTYRHIVHSIKRKDGQWENDYSKLGLKAYKTKNRDYTENIMKDGSITKNYSKNFWDNEKWDKILYSETFDYTYHLKNGNTQNRKATIKIEKREWRRYFLWWTSWNNKINTFIDIQFDKEVGERSGS